jgi:Glucose / Sorbosone dehydrogenase/Cytochrome c
MSRFKRDVLVGVPIVALAALAVWQSSAAQDTRLALELEDYVQMPVTGELDGQNTRGQLARVNYLREEPGGRRFFVNDLNGPLYILDKQTKTFTTYLDFNGAGGRPDLFRKFTFERNFATGLTNFIFDPDYARNGVFYTIHMEDPAVSAAAAPRAGVVAGLDLSGYTTTAAIPTPTVDGRIERDVVLIEWKDRDPANAMFEGTARELMRLQHPLPQHPLGDMTFNPVARPGDSDWRVMYLGAGDSGTGEQRDSRRLNPQRLDTLVGKILRIVPDLGEHTATSTVSENGRYRIPSDNPFSTLDGARKEIWAYGLRNPHRLIWVVEPARPAAPHLLAFNIGLVTWETVVIVHKGANYGYPLREGTNMMSSTNGIGPIPEDDTIPIQISDTVARGTVKPAYPVIQYPHSPAGGDGIANGFVYLGSRIAALKGKLVFGDITTGRLWYAELADVLAADDGNAMTLAPIHEIDSALRRLAEDTYRARGGKGEALPGRGAISGNGRVDVRFAADDDGELYLLTKSDGMIRKVVAARATTAPSSTTIAPTARSSSDVNSQAAASLRNPVAPTPDSIAAGKKVYDTNCAPCHGNMAQGAVKAGVAISIIEEQGGKQAPDLTDDQWDRRKRRRSLQRDQEGHSAHDDGGVRRAHPGQRDLEHGELPSHARFKEVTRRAKVHGGLLHRQDALHAGHEVTREGAQVGITAWRGRHFERDLHGLPGPRQRRHRQDLRFHRRRDVAGGACGRRCVCKRRRIGPLGEQHEVVPHHNLRQRADRLQAHLDRLARLGRDRREIELHLVVAGEVHDARLGLRHCERGRGPENDSGGQSDEPTITHVINRSIMIRPCTRHAVQDGVCAGPASMPY